MPVTREVGFHQNISELLFLIRKDSKVKVTLSKKLVNKIDPLWDHPFFTATVHE
jgi:hypothetical protein